MKLQGIFCSKPMTFTAAEAPKTDKSEKTAAPATTSTDTPKLKPQLTEDKVELKGNTAPQTKDETKADAKADVKADAKDKTEAKTDAKPEVKASTDDKKCKNCK